MFTSSLNLKCEWPKALFPKKWSSTFFSKVVKFESFWSYWMEPDIFQTKYLKSWKESSNHDRLKRSSWCDSHQLIIQYRLYCICLYNFNCIEKSSQKNEYDLYANRNNDKAGVGVLMHLCQWAQNLHICMHSDK